MAGFFNLRNDSTKFLLIGIPVAALVAIDYTAPQYLTDAGYLALAVIFAIPGGMWLNAIINGHKYPHVEHSIFDSLTGIAYAVKDFFIETGENGPQPGKKVPHVIPYGMEKACWCLKEKKWLPKGFTGSACPCGGNIEEHDVPRYIWGRWWWVYVVVTHYGVTFGEFNDAKVHFWITPDEWYRFLKSGGRPEGAILDGEVIDHNNSSHVDSILAPFTVDILGVKVPVYLSVFSQSSVLKITKGWTKGMHEVARFVNAGMEEFLAENKPRMFPEVSPDKTFDEVFPELRIMDRRKGDGTD